MLLKPRLNLATLACLALAFLAPSLAYLAFLVFSYLHCRIYSILKSHPVAKSIDTAYKHRMIKTKLVELFMPIFPKQAKLHYP